MTRLKLSPGEIIILHTDGITEARNSVGAEYGLERLIGFLKEHRQLPVSELTAACIADLKEFRAISEDLDDVTIMAIKRSF